MFLYFDTISTLFAYIQAIVTEAGCLPKSPNFTPNLPLLTKKSKGEDSSQKNVVALQMVPTTDLIESGVGNLDHL